MESHQSGDHLVQKRKVTRTRPSGDTLPALARRHSRPSRLSSACSCPPWGKKNQALATIYQGALSVPADLSHPDRYSLSAHGMRELMEKLPTYLEVPTGARHESPLSKAREIEAAFERIQELGPSTAITYWRSRSIDA